MTSPQLSDAAAAPAALAAFLRGIERRGAVFAELHCGDPAVADQALALALRVFRDVAVRTPFAQWPRLFWTALLASPPLRTPPPAPHWPTEFAPLAGVGSGPRAALLLRLVAGLGDADAATVLGIARPTYRLALQRALPHRPDGSPDEAAWRALGEAVQQATRQLPAARLAHLARLREAAIQGRRPDLIGPLPPAAAEDAAAPATPRWRMPALWAASALTGLALAATFSLPDRWLPEQGDPRIRVRPLPPAELPAATYGAEAALLTERDFEQLVDVADTAVVRELDLYAWYAAEEAAQAAGTAGPAPSPVVEFPLPAGSAHAGGSNDAPR